MITVSQSAIAQVVTDIQTGADAEYVESFFAARPEWNTEDETTAQTVKQPEVETAQA